MIRAVEEAFSFGFPTDAGAVLIIEIDGLDAGLEREAQAIAKIVEANGGRTEAGDPLEDAERAGVRGHLEEPQIGLRSDRAALAGVLHARRRRPSHPTAGRFCERSPGSGAH